LAAKATQDDVVPNNCLGTINLQVLCLNYSVCEKKHRK